MPFMMPYMSTNRYGGPGYGSGGGSKMNRKPSYSSQLSSDGYSSASGSYKSGYGGYRTGNQASYAKESAYISPSVDRYPSSSLDRPNSVAGAPYSKDYRRMSSYNSGYTSDYGRSGYASGTGCKSGYGSDYGQSGYASGTGYASDYGRSGYASGTGYASDYGRARYGPGSGTSGYEPRSNNYSSHYYHSGMGHDKSPDRMSSRSGYTPASYGYSRSSVNRDSGVGSYYPRSNYGAPQSSYGGARSSRDAGTSSYNRGNSSYSRNIRHEEAPVSAASSGLKMAPRQRVPPEQQPMVNKTEHRKSKECKAPADFTSDSSSSDEDDDDSQNEDAVLKYMISRSTSPTQKPPPPGMDFSKSISALVKSKCPQPNSKIKILRQESGTQTSYEDMQPSTVDVTTSKPRYVSSGIAKPTAGYYDRYYGRYTSPSYTSGSSAWTSARVYGGRTDSALLGSDTSNRKLASGQQQVTSRQNSHEGSKSPNPPSSPKTPPENVANSGPMTSEIENKEFRKSVLNMNIVEKDCEKRSKHERSPKLGTTSPVLHNGKSFGNGPTEPPSESTKHPTSGIKKTHSRTRIGPEEDRRPIAKSHSRSKLDAERCKSRDSSDSDSATNDRKIYRTHSRSKLNNHDKDDERPTTAICKSYSKTKIDGHSRRGSGKGSQEDLVESKRRGSRERMLDEQPRSRRGSRDDVLDERRRSPREDLRRTRNRDDGGDSDAEEDARSVRSATSHRVRRKNSKDNNLDDVDDQQQPQDSRKPQQQRRHRRQGSLEGVLDDLPPRPSRHGSRESILDEKPRRRYEPAGEDNRSSTTRTSPQLSRGNSGPSRDANQVGATQTPSRSGSREKLLEDKSVPAAPVQRSGIPVANNSQPCRSNVIPTVKVESNQQNSKQVAPRPEAEESSEEEEEEEEEEESEEEPDNEKAGDDYNKPGKFGQAQDGLRKRSSPDGIDGQRQTSSPSCHKINQNAPSAAVPNRNKPDSGSSSKVGTGQHSQMVTRRPSAGDPVRATTIAQREMKKKFIGNMKDIDSLLSDEKAEGGTFEDFEKKFNDKGMIVVSAPPPGNQQNVSKGDRKEEAKNNLGLFIGKCKDIDDVLGSVLPISPGTVQAAAGELNQSGKAPPPVRPNVLPLKKVVQSSESSSDEQPAPAPPTSVPNKESSVEEESEEEEEEGTSSSAVEEVEAHRVKVHEGKAQQPQLETYTEEIDSSAVRIRESKAHAPELQTYTEEIDSSGVRIREQKPMKGRITSTPTPKRLDDCTLQLYRHSNSNVDYGTYLDLESTIDEQQEEFDGFLDNRKNAIILRTQLPVRVHAIIEKLMHSEGRELRRALFSLKQIFQDDKDLVHEFVQNDGLACLIKVGSEADQNYQNYILRALGQVMLYVDGMNGVIEHNETIQWLYSLISSKYRLVVKTALKLLLVFVEYTESNCLLLINAVNSVDSTRGVKSWTNIMVLLNEKDSVDMELLIFAMTLINKMLNGIPDQDTYYDVVDCLEEQGMERIIQRYMSKQGTDLDLLQQFQIYEAVLKQEDGDEDGPVIPLDPNFRQVPRSRKSLDDNDRRKSRRHSLGNVIITPPTRHMMNQLPATPEEPFKRWHREDNHSGDSLKRNDIKMNGTHLEINDLNGVTPGLRKRRERDARHRSFIKEQEGSSPVPPDKCEDTRQLKSPCIEKPLVDRQRVQIEDENRKNREISKIPCRFVDDRAKVDNKIENQRFLTTTRSRSNKEVTEQHPPTTRQENGLNTNKKSWMLSMMYSKSQDEENKKLLEGKNSLEPLVKEEDKITDITSPRISQAEVFDLRREGTVKDIQKKLRTQESLTSPTDGNNRIGDFSGLVNKAKEGLNKSTSRTEIKSPGVCSPGTPESKKAENDFQWEQLIKTLERPLRIKDMDFTDLTPEDDLDVFQIAWANGMANGTATSPPPPMLGPPPGPRAVANALGAPPPPPPPMMGIRGPPPPPPPFGGPPPLAFGNRGPPPPPPLNSGIPSPFVSRFAPPTQTSSGPTVNSNHHYQQHSLQNQTQKTIKKNKKTVKLFWKEVRDDPVVKIKVKSLIWDELKPVNIDTQKLEHLFENRAKDLMSKKQQEMNRNKEIIVLDPKRSNAINIGMTKLPPPRTIKTAILKMDSTIMNREGIEKILTIMMPTEEEKAKIMEAQNGNPDVPLGSAEQFLLTLASISELPARLKLWAFKLDYDIMEREVAEPLMDLKQGLEELKQNKTFKCILSTLLSIGNFLNGVEAKGFQIDYLAKVPEVKDTVHKHSLLHHLCHMVMEKFPDTSDLYCEIGAVSRASKVDFEDLAINLQKMETECKASWDHLKAIAKHDGSTNMKTKMSEFLAECAERIIVLGIIHRRVINRFFRFLIYLGIPHHTAKEMKINQFLKIVSEFALEYRTTRERVLQQLEKKANHRERNKTRGKMITDVGKFKSKEVQADEELRRQLLGSGVSDNEDYKWSTVPGFRGRLRKQDVKGSPLNRNTSMRDENLTDGMTDGDDEILESLVKTATAPSLRSTPRERKRARQADRKSLRRTLKNGLSDEEKKFLAAFST